MRRSNKLILFLVMATFLFAAVASASAAMPNDVGQDAVGTKYETAVKKLAALKILKGYEDGTVKPDQSITRAEFAAIAIQELGLSDQITNIETQFTDVPASHWASGIVNLAAGKGIIKGFPDGTFRPDEQVTYAQAAAMLVQMLGWGPAIDGQPWPSAVLYRAADLEISKDVTMDASAAANRGDIFIMASNALESDIMDQTRFGDNNDWEKSNETPLEKYFDIKIVEDLRVTAVYAVEDGLDQDEITLSDLDNDEYGDYALLYDSPIDFLGIEVDAWINEDDDEVYYIEQVTSDKNVVYDTITAASDSKDEVTLKVKDDEYDVARDAVIYVNNKEVSLSQLDKAGDAYGRIVFSNKDVVFAYLFDFVETGADYGAVTEVEDTEYTYYNRDADDDSIDLDDYDEVFAMDANLAAVDAEDIDVDSLIYFWDNDDDELYLIVNNNTIEGALDRPQNSSVRIGDTKYDAATMDGSQFAIYTEDDRDDFDTWGNADDLKDLDEEEVLAVLDLNGDIYAIIGDPGATSDTMYGIVTYADKSGKSEATVFLKDGEEYDYEFEERSDLPSLAGYNFYSEDGALKYAITKFELNKDGEIDEDFDASKDWKASDAPDGDLIKQADKKFFEVGSDRYYIEDNTIFMKALNDKGELDPTVLKNEDVIDAAITSSDNSEVVIFVSSDNHDAKLVVFTEQDFNAVADDDYAGVVIEGPWRSGDDYKVIIDVCGEGEKEYVVDKRADFQEGDVVAFRINSKGEASLSGISVVTDDNGVGYDDGYFTKLDDGKVKLDKNVVLYELESDRDIDGKIRASQIKDYDVVEYVIIDEVIKAAVAYDGEADEDEDIEKGTITNINVDENLIEVDGEVLELDTKVRLLDANGATLVIGKNAVVEHLFELYEEGDVVLDEIVKEDGIVSEIKLADNEEDPGDPGDTGDIEVAATFNALTALPSFGTVSIEVDGTEEAVTFTVTYELPSGAEEPTAAADIDAESPTIFYNEEVTIELFDAEGDSLGTFVVEI